MRKVAKIIGAVLWTAGLLAVAVGLLMALWMQVAAKPGESFQSVELGMAIAWSGLIFAIIGFFIHGLGEGW